MLVIWNIYWKTKPVVVCNTISGIPRNIFSVFALATLTCNIQHNFVGRFHYKFRLPIRQNFPFGLGPDTLQEFGLSIPLEHPWNTWCLCSKSNKNSGINIKKLDGIFFLKKGIAIFWKGKIVLASSQATLRQDFFRVLCCRQQGPSDRAPSSNLKSNI